jgi:hypothetical protein
MALSSLPAVSSPSASDSMGCTPSPSRFGRSTCRMRQEQIRNGNVEVHLFDDSSGTGKGDMNPRRQTLLCT